VKNFYHKPGLTDLQAQKDEALRRLNKGESSIVHLHTYSEPCAETHCIVFNPDSESVVATVEG
jgi:hypothetical protein